jgi:hypothetical protein
MSEEPKRRRLEPLAVTTQQAGLMARLLVGYVTGWERNDGELIERLSIWTFAVAILIAFA